MGSSGVADNPGTETSVEVQEIDVRLVILNSSAIKESKLVSQYMETNWYLILSDSL